MSVESLGLLCALHAIGRYFSTGARLIGLVHGLVTCSVGSPIGDFRHQLILIGSLSRGKVFNNQTANARRRHARNGNLNDETPNSLISETAHGIPITCDHETCSKGTCFCEIR